MITKDVLLPHGLRITIKEHNGEDEDVLSRLGDVDEGISYSKFLSRIITGSNIPDKQNFTTDDINEWPEASKYVALVESRILSIGDMLDFKLKCQDAKCGHESPYSVDLKEYSHDLSQGNPSPDDPHYSSKPKLFLDYREKYSATMKDGKEITWTPLTSLSGMKLTKKERDDINHGDAFRIRNLTYKAENGEVITITNFRMFTARQMAEIRGLIKEKEFDYDLTAYCKCDKCKKINTIAIFNLHDFFFPAGI